MNKILSFALLSITSCGFAQTRLSSAVDTVQKINQLEEVVVTAQYSPQSLKNSVYKVRTINSAKIRLSGATSLQQVLNTEVGFRFNTDLLLGVSDFEMMGMSGRNIKILLDGVPMVDRSDTRESLNQIDINTIERVEIVEGPVSVVYGTDALAGVINIITKSSQQGNLKIDARFQDETAGKEYQTFSGKGSHNQHINASWERNGWSVLAGGSHNEFGGWNQPASTLSIQEFSQVSWWRPKEQYLANAKLGYQNDKLHLWYRIDALSEDIDSRFGMNPNNFKGILQTYRTNRYTHQLQSTLKLSPKISFSGILGYTNLTRSTKTTERDFSTGVEMLTTAAGQQDVATFNSSIFRATSTFNLIESLAIQTGVEWNRDEASAARISGNPVINDFALFASSEMQWGKLSLRPGLRFIANSVFEAPPVIPSLNAKLAIAKDVDLRLGYARGFRSPALRELYYNFVDASHTIYGNPNLKAEESDSFNGSVAWTALQQPDLVWSMNASGFYNFFRNRIDFAQDPNDNTITTLFNVARFRTAGGGIEQHLDYRQLKAAIALLYVGRYNNLLVNDPALQVPTMMWAPELSLNLNYGFAKSGTNIGIFYKYTGARPSYQLINNSPRQVEIGHFNWVDFMVNQKINRFVNLNAGIKNLFNITLVNSTSTASGGAHSTGGGSVAMSYGRSYVLGLSFSWTKN